MPPGALFPLLLLDLLPWCFYFSLVRLTIWIRFPIRFPSFCPSPPSLPHSPVIAVESSAFCYLLLSPKEAFFHLPFLVVAVSKRVTTKRGSEVFFLKLRRRFEESQERRTKESYKVSGHTYRRHCYMEASPDEMELWEWFSDQFFQREMTLLCAKSGDATRPPGLRNVTHRPSAGCQNLQFLTRFLH
jgi:hypothetical protein